jgi:hypothetical protein
MANDWRHDMHPLKILGALACALAASTVADARPLTDAERTTLTGSIDAREQAVRVDEFVGFGARPGRADLCIGEHLWSPESTTIFDRACHDFASPIRWMGMDGHGRPRPNRSTKRR